MTGIAARARRTAANRLSSNTACHSASSASRNEVRGSVAPGTRPPALLTSTSMPPNASTARATIASGASGSVKSAATWTTSSASSSGVDRRDVATTPPPSSTSVRVLARPMPFEAPVTTATRPLRSSCMRNQRSVAQGCEAAFEELALDLALRALQRRAVRGGGLVDAIQAPQEIRACRVEEVVGVEVERVQQLKRGRRPRDLRDHDGAVERHHRGRRQLVHAVVEPQDPAPVAP